MFSHCARPECTDPVDSTPKYASEMQNAACPTPTLQSETGLYWAHYWPVNNPKALHTICEIFVHPPPERVYLDLAFFMRFTPSEFWILESPPDFAAKTCSIDLCQPSRKLKQHLYHRHTFYFTDYISRGRTVNLSSQASQPTKS